MYLFFATNYDLSRHPSHFRINVLVDNDNASGQNLWWVGILPRERVQGLDCSLPGVQRFGTQTEGHKPVAWAHVLINRQILLLPLTSEVVIWGQKKQTSLASKMLVLLTLVLQLSCLTVATPSIQGVSQVKLQQIRWYKMYIVGEWSIWEPKTTRP